MVKIVLSGGTSSLAREVTDALVATKKHEILIMTRNAPGVEQKQGEGIAYAVTDYSSVEELSTLVRGYDTVISFIAPFHNQSEAVLAQRHLIDASVKAGVRRFAPSEWVSPGLQHMPWYDFKLQTREHLEGINKNSKVLEYCLFQPGLFANYLAHPYKSPTHVPNTELMFDFGNRRMIVCEGGESGEISFTTIRDVANVIALAVEYDGEWPKVGGMKGGDLSSEQLVALAEELRGPLVVDKVKESQLHSGTWSTSWLPRVEHPNIPPEQTESASRTITAGMLLSFGAGDFRTNGAWNALLPNYKFEDVESFLREAWHGKP